MQNSQGLFRVLRISPYVRLGVKGYLEKNVLMHRRLFHNKNIRKPKHKSPFIYRTAILTGTLVVGGLAIKLFRDTNGEGQDNVPYWQKTSSLSLTEAIERSRDLVQMSKVESGSPGLAVAVSVDGKIVWEEGLGYSDIENLVKCKPQSVFRIASISKPITMAAVAKLVENGILDLDKPVQYYVPDFPEKTWEGEKVEITTRQLVSHIGGIRDYSKNYMMSSEEKKKIWTDEIWNTKHYHTVVESLDMFKDDPLVHKPGSKFLYSSFGWTLISAVVEAAAKIPFEKLMKNTFDELGLENTYIEEDGLLIRNRGRHYIKNKNGKIINVHYANMSYKWAGAGYISNVLDLAKFGNAMLFSYKASPLPTASRQSETSNQYRIEKSPQSKGNDKTGMPSRYLKHDTMKKIWTPVVNLVPNLGSTNTEGYGMGWELCNQKHEYAFSNDQTFYATHGGGAIGGTCMLLILPTRNSQPLHGKTSVLKHDNDGNVNNCNTVKNLQETSRLNTSLQTGVVVAIIVNMMHVDLNKTAYNIAKIFEQVDFKK